MRSIAAALLAVLLPLTANAAVDQATPEVDLIVVGIDGSLTELREQLSDILSNPPLALDGRVQSARAGSFRASDLFSLTSAGANHPAAWVIVESGVVHIRAAGAGRAQFVFRDITISQPMTDLDRERIGQTLRSALTVVIEGSPGGMGRSDAQRAVDFEEPRPPARPAPVATPPPPPPPQPPPAPPSSGESPLQFHLAGLFELALIHSHYAYGPGVFAGLDTGAIPLHPGIWMLAVTFIPDWMTSSSTVAAYSSSVRFGAGAKIPGTSSLRLELGFGYDWNRPGYTASGIEQISVYRGAVRIGPSIVFGVRSSLSLYVEEATSSFDSSQSDIPGGPSTRSGLAVELWWL